MRACVREINLYQVFFTFLRGRWDDEETGLSQICTCAQDPGEVCTASYQGDKQLAVGRHRWGRVKGDSLGIPG